MASIKSCTLCVHFVVKEGKLVCEEIPDAHKKPNFPFKDTKCRHYRYVFDFSRLYCRVPETPRSNK